MNLMAGIVLAVLATANLYVPDLGGGVLVDPTTIALGLAMLLAARAWVRDRFRVGAAHGVLAVVVVSFLPGLAMAADHSYGRFKVQGILAAFAVTWAALQLLGAERVRAVFVRTLGVSGVVVSAALALFGEAATFSGRASIFGLNPISLGRMTALGALLAMLAVPRARGVRLAALLAVAVLCCYAAFITGSRGPLAAVGAAVLVAALPSRRRLGRRTLYTGGVLGAVGVTGAVVLLSGRTADASAGRVDLWRDSFLLALHRPAGVGFGNLHGNIPAPRWPSPDPYVEYSHNMLLEATVEGGWVALAGLLVALVVSFRCLYRGAHGWTGGAMLAVWVFAAVNAMVSSDLVGNRLVWVMIGAGLALLTRRSVPERTEAPATTRVTGARAG